MTTTTTSTALRAVFTAATLTGAASFAPAFAQEAIMLETIGAVRMLPPQEARTIEARRQAEQPARTVEVARTTHTLQ